VRRRCEIRLGHRTDWGVSSVRVVTAAAGRRPDDQVGAAGGGYSLEVHVLHGVALRSVNQPGVSSIAQREIQYLCVRRKGREQDKRPEPRAHGGPRKGSKRKATAAPETCVDWALVERHFVEGPPHLVDNLSAPLCERLRPLHCIPRRAAPS